MAKYLEVNGARLEQEFFEENLAEARECTWTPARVTDSTDHEHCIVCTAAISPGDPAYRDGNRWLCDYCKARFIGPEPVSARK